MSKAIKTLAIAILAGSASAAFAQGQPPYGGGNGARDAPPIHRGPIYNGFDHQPREQNLPPAVRRNEGHTTPAQRDFDQGLQICRPC
jgi:hypothetical protein